jgi:hypothetical protein
VKILFDNNVPTYLLPLFQGASTAYREGWQELSNGNLLDAAEQAGFTLLVTLDRGFRSQQRMARRTIAVAVLETESQARSSMFSAAEALVSLIDEIQPASVVTVRSAP